MDKTFISFVFFKFWYHSFWLVFDLYAGDAHLDEFWRYRRQCLFAKYQLYFCEFCACRLLSFVSMIEKEKAPYEAESAKAKTEYEKQLKIYDKKQVNEYPCLTF